MAMAPPPTLMLIPGVSGGGQSQEKKQGTLWKAGGGTPSLFSPELDPTH